MTIVTAYFKINRTRNINYTNGRKKMPKDSDGIYREWMKGLLSYNGPMIIFTDIKTFKYIKKLRQNYKQTKIIITTIEKLEAYKYFDNNKLNLNKYPTMIWKEHNNSDINKKLYTLWNSKFSLLKKAVDMNPFNTHYFIWFDIGYIRDINKTLESNWPNNNKLKILDDKILLLTVYGGPKCNQGGIVAGGFIGCNKNNIYKVHDTFIEILKKKIKNNEFSGNDQLLYNELRCSYPNLVQAIKGEKTDYFENVPHNEWFYTIPYFS